MFELYININNSNNNNTFIFKIKTLYSFYLMFIKVYFVIFI